MKSVAFIAWALLVAGCEGALPQVSAADRDYAHAQFAGESVDLEAGRSLYGGKCSGCHALYLPTEVPQAQWPDKMQEMSARAKLEPADQRVILRYLMTASRKQ